MSKVDKLTSYEISTYLSLRFRADHMHDDFVERLKAGAIIDPASRTELFLVECEAVVVNWRKVASNLAKRFLGKRAVAYLNRVIARGPTRSQTQLRSRPNKLWVPGEPSAADIASRRLSSVTRM